MLMPKSPESNAGNSAPEEGLGQAAILDAAEAAFSVTGYAGTKMSEVARRARASLTTLYGRYESKMSLYRAVHHRRLQALMARIRAVSVPPDDLLGGMLEGVHVYLAFHMEHPNYLRMHLREGVAWSGPSELLSPEQVDAWSRGVERMARAFERGMDAGLYVRDDPRLCARRVNAFHQVALSDWVERGMIERPRQLSRRIAHHFVRSFCEPSRVPELLERLEQNED